MTRRPAPGAARMRVMVIPDIQLEDVIMEPQNVTPPQELETLPLDFHLHFLST